MTQEMRILGELQDGKLLLLTYLDDIVGPYLEVLDVMDTVPQELSDYEFTEFVVNHMSDKKLVLSDSCHRSYFDKTGELLCRQVFDEEMIARIEEWSRLKRQGVLVDWEDVA